MYTYCKILHIMNMYIFKKKTLNIAVRSDSVNIAVNPKKKITLDYFLYRDQYFSELAFFFSSNSTRALMACRSSLRILLPRSSCWWYSSPTTSMTVGLVSVGGGIGGGGDGAEVTFLLELRCNEKVNFGIYAMDMSLLNTRTFKIYIFLKDS